MTETAPNRSARRPQVSVIGDGHLEAEDPRQALAYDVGRALVAAGARVVTGGLGGVMAAAHRGAAEAPERFDGATIALLPGSDPRAANPWAEVVLPTGLGIGRNLVVAHGDAVIVIGGGSGTLSEVALAWQLGRPIVALGDLGWAGRLAGERVDPRDRGVGDDRVHPAATAEQAVQIALARIEAHRATRSPGR